MNAFEKHGGEYPVIVNQNPAKAATPLRSFATSHSPEVADLPSEWGGSFTRERQRAAAFLSGHSSRQRRPAALLQPSTENCKLWAV